MKCVFPFTHGGATYHGCVSDVAPPKEDKQSREQAAPVDTVVHSRGGIPHRIVVLFFVVMCQLVLSSFSICVLDSLDTEEARGAGKYGAGFGGYGSMDPQGPPTYTPGYASTYAPPTNVPRAARVTSGSYASLISPAPQETALSAPPPVCTGERLGALQPRWLTPAAQPLNRRLCASG